MRDTIERIIADVDHATKIPLLPDVLILQEIKNHADEDFRNWLSDRKNSRKLALRLEACGYVAAPNKDQKDGRWKVGGKSVRLYAKTAFLPRAHPRG